MVKNNTWVMLGILILIALMVALGIMVTKQTDETQMPAGQNQVGQQQAQQNEPQPSQEQENDNSRTTEDAAVVMITDGTFNPATLTVAKGTVVTFTNNDSELRWPAVDPHPTHTGLAGFDPERPMEPGESWSYKFDQAGTFRYHDHLMPSLKGTIVVE